MTTPQLLRLLNNFVFLCWRHEKSCCGQSSTQRLRVHADGVSNQHNNVFDGNFNEYVVPEGLDVM